MILMVVFMSERVVVSTLAGSSVPICKMLASECNSDGEFDD